MGVGMGVRAVEESEKVLNRQVREPRRATGGVLIKGVREPPGQGVCWQQRSASDEMGGPGPLLDLHVAIFGLRFRASSTRNHS